MASVLPFNVTKRNNLDYGTTCNKAMLPFETHESLTPYIKLLPRSIKRQHRRLRKFVQRQKVQSYNISGAREEKHDVNEHLNTPEIGFTRSIKTPAVTRVFIQPQNENPHQNRRETTTWKSDTHLNRSKSQASTNLNTRNIKPKVSEKLHDSKDAIIHRLEKELEEARYDIQYINQLLKQKDETIDTLSKSLNQVREVIDGVAENPRYLQISGCRNFQIGDGNSQTVHVKPVKSTNLVKEMMENLCNKQDEIEVLIKDALEKIKDDNIEEVTLQMELRDNIHKINRVLSRKLTRVELKALGHRNGKNDDAIHEEERNGHCHIWMPTNELRSMKSKQERLSRSQEELRDDSRTFQQETTETLSRIEGAILMVKEKS